MEVNGHFPGEPGPISSSSSPPHPSVQEKKPLRVCGTWFLNRYFCWHPTIRVKGTWSATG